MSHGGGPGGGGSPQRGRLFKVDFPSAKFWVQIVFGGGWVSDPKAPPPPSHKQRCDGGHPATFLRGDLHETPPLRSQCQALQRMTGSPHLFHTWCGSGEGQPIRLGVLVVRARLVLRLADTLPPGRGGGGAGKSKNGRTPQEEGGGTPPWTPPPQTKGTIAGKNETYPWETLVGPFSVHTFLGLRPHPLLSSNPSPGDGGRRPKLRQFFGCQWVGGLAGVGQGPNPPPPSSRGQPHATKTRSDPRRVRMSSGERPIGAAKGKQSDTEALCQPPPP